MMVAPERDMPGHNRWIIQLCKRAGFRPRFLLDADSLTEGLAAIVMEGAVSLLPEYTKRAAVPGVVFRTLRDAGIVVAGSSDHPIGPLSPHLGIAAAIDRKAARQGWPKAKRLGWKKPNSPRGKARLLSARRTPSSASPRKWPGATQIRSAISSGT